MIVFIKAINRHTAVKHNAEHTDVLKKLKTVLVQYTIHKTALINIIYFRGRQHEDIHSGVKFNTES